MNLPDPVDGLLFAAEVAHRRQILDAAPAGSVSAATSNPSPPTGDAH